VNICVITEAYSATYNKHNTTQMHVHPEHPNICTLALYSVQILHSVQILILIGIGQQPFRHLLYGHRHSTTNQQGIPLPCHLKNFTVAQPSWTWTTKATEVCRLVEGMHLQ